MVKVGLLLPNSTLYPGLGFDIIEGLKAGFSRVDQSNVVLIVEGIGFGTNPDDVLAKAQKLLMQESVDAVVAMMSRRLAEQLVPLFTAANRLLLVLDVLGDFFGAELPGPTVFYHSLQACLGSRVAGRKAAESGAQRVVQAASFYDAGYRQGYAMAKGVEANGGQLVQYVVSSHVLAQVTLQPLQAICDTGEAQAITALYAGDLAEQFYRLYAAVASPLPLWVAPLLLEEQLLDTLTAAPDGVRGYVSWSERLENDPNEQFMAALRQRGRRPTLFSLLAYEGAEILATYLDPVKSRGYPTPADFQVLTRLTFRSPRGGIQFDPATHVSFGPHYPATLSRTQSGRYQLTDLADASMMTADKQQIETEPLPMDYSGWHNTYLCI